MAKPIELALSKVWRLPAIKKLNNSQVGAFVLLAREAIYDGLDPLAAPRLTLQNICRCNPQQWPHVWRGLRPALEEALSILRASYDQQLKTQKCRGQHAKLHFASINAARHEAHLVTLARKRDREKAKRLADAPDPALGAMQPIKAPIFRPSNIDYQARAQVVEKRKAIPLTGTVLHD